MKAKLDILLGAAAWLIASVPLLFEWIGPQRYGFEIRLYVAPALWCCAVVAMMAVRRRHMKKLWWVWPSAPFAFLIWLAGMIVSIGSVMR
ncbi:hypothetical protein AAU61_03780 [Desulfocarbo indianensis]|nr:hypothetical protein AAU61_03780 [Desulfocarbo indianensis]